MANGVANAVKYFVPQREFCKDPEAPDPPAPEGTAWLDDVLIAPCLLRACQRLLEQLEREEGLADGGGGGKGEGEGKGKGKGKKKKGGKKGKKAKKGPKSADVVVDALRFVEQLCATDVELSARIHCLCCRPKHGRAKGFGVNRFAER